MKAIGKTLRSLQWQLTITIVVAGLILMVVLMGVRIYNAVQTYSTVRSGSVVAGAAWQLAMNPRFRNYSVSNLIDGDESMDHKDVPVPIDFGSMMRDMQVDMRYFSPASMQLYYIDSELNVKRVPLGMADKPEDNYYPDEEIAQIIQTGIELSENASYEQVILTEDDHSMALVPHLDPMTGEKGHFFLYVVDPDFSNLLVPILRSSLKEMWAMLAITAGLGLVIGFIFSRRWIGWFQTVSAAMQRWTEGDLTRRVQLNGVVSVAEWDRLADDLNDMADRLEEVMETNRDLAVLEERNKISRELHDNIKQQLFSINMNLGAAQALEVKNPEKAAEKIQLTGAMTLDALLDLDTLIGSIRPGNDENRKSLNNLNRYMKTWQESSGIALKKDIDDAVKITDEEIASAILRISQEALSNVSRHSGAKHAEIRLEADELEVHLTISDDGKGFDAENGTDGIGLTSMRERTEQLNGSFEVHSKPGKTVISVCIPQKVTV